MKEKILNALRTKFKNLGLSEKAFDGVAEFYLKTITDESKIEEGIEGSEPLLKAIQAEADRARTGSQSKQTELEAKISELEAKLSKPVEPKPSGVEPTDNAELDALKKRIDDLDKAKQSADKASREKALVSSAKELMIKSGVSNELCDDMLSDLQISDEDTAETLSQKGVEKFNYLKTKFTPQAGQPMIPEGTGGDNYLSSYFESKNKEREEALKIQENAEIK